jgi:hypothetical protein
MGESIEANRLNDDNCKLQQSKGSVAVAMWVMTKVRAKFVSRIWGIKEEME